MQDSPRERFCLQCGAPLETRTLDGVERRCCAANGCGYVHWGNPTPVAAALVEHEGGVILVRAPGWPETWYGLVTGFVERREGPREAAVRELHEELGLESRSVRLIGAYPFRPMNQIIIAYHIEAEGVITPSAEIAAWKRVHVEKLRPWPEGTGEAVRDWLAERAAAKR